MDQYDGPERRISPQLTDAQIEAIAERASPCELLKWCVANLQPWTKE